MSSMLFDEEPLLVPRKLARALGVNEAIIVQQIHYWIDKRLHFHDGKYWTYNTYKEWGKQFDHLSPRAIRRYINKLEKMGILDSNQYSSNKYDHTKWYTIDYETLESYREIEGADDVTDLDTSGLPKVVTSITKNTTKTNKTYIGEFENVGLTDNELTKLNERFGVDLTNRLVEKLSTYIQSSPQKAKKYKSHYSVLIGWVIESVLEHNPPKFLTPEQLKECEKKFSKISAKYQFNNGKFYLR